MHVYVDGAFAVTTRADNARGDVAAIYAASGAAHGFDVVARATPGAHTVCAYAINDGPAVNTFVGCREATVPSGPPIGSVDVMRGDLGAITLAGWAIDPDVANPIALHVYVDDTFARSVRADGERPDIAGAFAGYGAPHGFALRVAASGGAHTVCVYGINEGAGGNALIACRVVQVPGGAPIGMLDTVVGGAGSVRVAGWAIDPDVASPIVVHVYVDGVSRPFPADDLRDDLTAALGPYGGAHGFAADLQVGPGPHDVCVYALDSAQGVNALLGCRRVTST
jgi:hypothetical protein